MYKNQPIITLYLCIFVKPMNGILVVNHFLKSEKFEELHSHLRNAAANMGVSLLQKTNLELASETPECDFVLFWDKDVNLAKRLENAGLPVFNSARSIALCDDKAKTLLALEGIVPQPETLIAPLAFGKADYSAFVDAAIERLGLPLVFKECFGSFGEQVFLRKSREEILAGINGRPFLLQKFVEGSRGEDTRIEVIGGRAVCAMRRRNADDFRSNITNGGTAEAYTPTAEEAALAVKACEALGLSFGGVDILNNGSVCEVNSNAHIINIMRATGIDLAPMIFEEIEKQIK